jgi:hypothetical protein
MRTLIQSPNDGSVDRRPFMTLTTGDSNLVTQASSANVVLARDAEKTLLHRIIIGVAFATPIFIGLWVGLIAVAVRHSAHMAGPIGMAVGIGVLNGVFFGTWAGFVASNDTFDELDHLADIADQES